MFDILRLRLLREFSQRGTMTAVAEAFGLTSSAVSQQLATLAHQARVPLFERIGRRVRLTAEGIRLAVHADVVLEAVEAAESDMRAAKAAPHGALRVASFATFAKTRLLPAVMLLQKRHRQLQVILQELEPADAIDAVRSGMCDIAVTFVYNIVPRADRAGLVAQPLLDEPVLLALPRTWQRARNPIDLKRLANEQWIVGSRGSDDHQLAERACAMAGFAPRITHTIDDYDLQLRMISAGLGIGFVPELGLHVPSARSVVVRTPGGVPLQRHVCALMRRTRAASPSVQALVGELRKAGT
jgi:DNA-binding transcriptional LysR family regulator